MPRAPNKKAEAALELYRQGKKLVEIAELLGVPDGTVRRWKSQYGWKNERMQESERSEQKASVRNETPQEVKSVLENPVLTDKQRLFCLYYAKSFNATRSYQKAYGCSYDTARTEGSALLAKPCIEAEIKRLKALRLSKSFLDENDLFQKYMDIAFSDITDFVSFGQEEETVMGAFGPVMVEDPETGEKTVMTRMVNSVRVRSSEDVDGSLITEVGQGKSGFKIKLADKLKALDWLANHMDLATEEQRAKVEHLKASTAKLRGDDPGGTTDDGFLDALRGKAADVWKN